MKIDPHIHRYHNDNGNDYYAFQGDDVVYITLLFANIFIIMGYYDMSYVYLNSKLIMLLVSL